MQICPNLIIPTMVHIPAGTFLMGEGKEAHEEQVKAFSIGVFPVTFEEYDQFCESTYKPKPSDQGWGRERRPVINVSWYDAMDYCNWLSEQTGYTYRLPTEIEWEYACRAGTTTKYFFGDDEKLLPSYAWFYENSHNKTHPVGLKAANNYGLYDMHGNVLEWCSTPWEAKMKVVRGGSWLLNAGYCRSAYRGFIWPIDRADLLGLRCVCERTTYLLLEADRSGTTTQRGSSTSFECIVNLYKLACALHPRSVFSVSNADLADSESDGLTDDERDQLL